MNLKDNFFRFMDTDKTYSNVFFSSEECIVAEEEDLLKKKTGKS